MYTNRLLQVVAVVVMLMAVAASGVAAAPAPTGPEGNVAYSQCQAILRQELGTVMPSGLSGYQESNCSTGDQAVPASVTGRGPYASPQAAGLSALDNPHNQWIGPETVSAALGQQSDSFPTTGGSGDLTSGAATWRDAGASGRGPYASPQAAPVSTGRQDSYGPPGR